jgi:hypothetical protein
LLRPPSGTYSSPLPPVPRFSGLSFLPFFLLKITKGKRAKGKSKTIY